MMRISISVGSALVGVLLNGSSVLAQLQYPAGTEDFESLNVGQSVEDLGWPVINESNPGDLFTVRATDMPEPRPGSTSTRWVNSNDQDPSNVQNRWYSNTITAPGPEDYTWTWYVRWETTPPGAGAVKPKLTIQHTNAGPFANAWGIEFTNVGANLIVLGIGGPAASVPLYPMVSPTGVGDWVKIELSVDFDLNTVSASANDGPSVSLPINLTGDEEVFRFCYRGEGSGNEGVMLVDDISVAVGAAQVIPTTSTWGLAVMAMLLLAGVKIHSRRRVAA